ncbi:MAG: hypothetical protein AB1411_15840 [Nitrospirota bacterium]
MTTWRSAVLTICIGCALHLAACSGPSWVHPNKPQEEFTQDYNRCEGDALRDPKLQQGSRYLLLEATERCMRKKGWVIKNTE